jgi:hypothetical protein
MKTIHYCLLMIVINLALYGCCFKFSDLASGSAFRVGDLINTSNKNILVEKFQYSDGRWTSTGQARVDMDSYSGGSGNEINARNVNLNFMIGYPVKTLTIKFGELGGNINITINENFDNLGDLISLNGTTLGGVVISVNAIKKENNWFGEMVLNGAINSFSIGGQELWIDNVCYKK